MSNTLLACFAVGSIGLFYIVLAVGAFNDWQDRKRRLREWLEYRREEAALDPNARGHKPERWAP